MGPRQKALPRYASMGARVILYAREYGIATILLRALFLFTVHKKGPGSPEPFFSRFPSFRGGSDLSAFAFGGKVHQFLIERRRRKIPPQMGLLAARARANERAGDQHRGLRLIASETAVQLGAIRPLDGKGRRGDEEIFRGAEEGAASQGLLAQRQSFRRTGRRLVIIPFPPSKNQRTFGALAG
jgi:hypothetical protein